MVSCDTWQASVPGCVRFSQPAICSGDQLRSSFAATACRNWPCTANLHGFGRSACFHAHLSAAAARYHRDPPLRPISRLIVDGARPNARAIERTDRPVSYARTTLARCWLDERRRPWRRAEERSGEIPEVVDATVDPALLHHRSAMRADLMAALASLPRRQRAVLVLRYFAGMSVAETAAALGCSDGTVKSA